MSYSLICYIQSYVRKLSLRKYTSFDCGTIWIYCLLSNVNLRKVCRHLFNVHASRLCHVFCFFVWCFMSVVFCLMFHAWCLISCVLCLVSDVWYLMSGVLCLMSFVSGVLCVIQYVSFLLTVVLCLLSQTTCLNPCGCLCPVYECYIILVVLLSTFFCFFLSVLPFTSSIVFCLVSILSCSLSCLYFTPVFSYSVSLVLRQISIRLLDVSCNFV